MKNILFGQKTIATDLPCFVMGIVNCTPDSFYAPSRGGLDRALELADEGADILDIGAESSRPGAPEVDEGEELRRLSGLVRLIRRKSDIPISIDTRKSVVIKAACDEGADALNDISALEDDAGCAPFAAESGIGVILMHKRGSPSTMMQNTKYDDVFSEVSSYLTSRADFAASCGIRRDRIIVDPGIGFAKDAEDCVALIRRCGELCGGAYPVLIGPSRKSFIRAALASSHPARGSYPGSSDASASLELYGTLAACTIAALSGAAILRVHDVAACKAALAVVKSFSR